MRSTLDKKRSKRTPFVILSVSGVIVVATCVFSGYQISGIGGALCGVFVGLTIYGC